MTDTIKPPLPVEHYIDGDGLWSERYGPYTEQQMLDYAAAAVAAERDRCAKIADAHARRNYPFGSENSDKYHAQAHWAERIAAAIRATEPKI